MSNLIYRLQELDPRQKLILFVILAFIVIFLLFILTPDTSQRLNYNYLRLVEDGPEKVIVEASKELTIEEKQKLESELKSRNSGKEVEVRESYEYSEEKQEILDSRARIEVNEEDSGIENQFPSGQPLHGGDYGQ